MVISKTVIRAFILVAILFSSCGNVDADRRNADSARIVDSIIKTGFDSLSKTATISPEKEIVATDFPLFTAYPEINSTGKTLNDFIPNGWTIRDTVCDDFNGDKQNDFAVVIQKKDSVRLVDVANDFVDTLLTQPRMLFVILKDPTTAHYKLSEQNHFFIPNHDRPTMEDPLQGMSFVKGVLQIDIQYFANMGSYEVSNLTYKFQFKQGKFVLIGGEYLDFMRNSGNEEACSYNFLTKKMKITTGANMFDEKIKGRETWETFELPELRTLEKMQPPGTWEVKKGHYL